MLGNLFSPSKLCYTNNMRLDPNFQLAAFRSFSQKDSDPYPAPSLRNVMLIKFFIIHGFEYFCFCLSTGFSYQISSFCHPLRSEKHFNY
jgi:hypothetical protein